jgi:hypothetical protein
MNQQFMIDSTIVTYQTDVHDWRWEWDVADLETVVVCANQQAIVTNGIALKIGISI